MQTITKTDALNDFCKKIKSSFITIDTEFLRDKTYYPKLCLVQIGGPDIEPAAIDPLAKSIDLSALIDLLKNKKILKVFHSGRQDMEIFYKLLDATLPEPVFDTQIAAAVLGYGEQVSYAVLVKKICGEDIDKGSQFTDWSHRPLSEKQINYAIGDVTHLIHVYEGLLKELKERGRESWTLEEMDNLCDPANYAMVPRDAWRRMKIRSKRAQDYAVLQKFASWRENLAQNKNIPRAHIMKDDVIAQIAMNKPRSKEGLKRIRGLSDGYINGEKGDMFLNMVADAVAYAKDNEIEIPSIGAKPTTDHSAAIDMLKLLLKLNCRDADIAPKMVALASDIDNLAMGNTKDLHLMKGWRYKVFGRDAEALLKGKLALRLNKGKIEKLT